MKKLKKILEDDKNKLNNSARLLRKSEVTVQILAQYNNNEKMFNNLDVSEIINNKKAILPVYLKEQARIIMNNKENEDIRKQL